MHKTPLLKIVYVFLVVLGVWMGLKFALPVAIPFLLGAAIAIAAEPMVGLLTKRLRSPRWLACGVGVTLVFLLLIGALVILIALLAKQAAKMAVVLPQLAEAAQSGLGSLESWLLTLASRAPGEVGNVLTGAVTELFSGSSAMMDGLIGRAVSLASRILTAVTDGALGFATGVLAAYMISVRLPQLRKMFRERLPEAWRSRYLPALKGLKGAMGGWIMAQIKLAGVALGLMLVSFWVLRIDYAPVWAAVIAVVDAFPILGCGTVLLPWSLICFLQGQRARAMGLLGVYALVWLTRSVLEPKLLGKELGLDPLLTLLSIYAGLKLFGFLGMLLAPMLAMTVLRLVKSYPRRGDMEG